MRQRSVGRLGSEDIVDRVGKIIHARDWDDDDVAMTLAVFGDAKKLAPAIFAQVDRKELPFDLQLS